MASDVRPEWDHVRIEGNGESGHGRVARVYRNGELWPGLVSFRLEVGIKGVQTLITTQYIVLEAPVTLEDAVQALEEREAIWAQEEPNAEQQ